MGLGVVENIGHSSVHIAFYISVVLFVVFSKLCNAIDCTHLYSAVPICTRPVFGEAVYGICTIRYP